MGQKNMKVVFGGVYSVIFKIAIFAYCVLRLKRVFFREDDRLSQAIFFDENFENFGRFHFDITKAI